MVNLGFWDCMLMSNKTHNKTEGLMEFTISPSAVSEALEVMVDSFSRHSARKNE